MDKYLKRIIISCFVVPSLIFMLIYVYLYFYDPLQIYNEKYPNYYQDDTRLSLPRIVKNYSFDSIILGSSKTNGFLPNEIKNGIYINTAVSNLDIFERYMMINYVISNKKIKNIVTSLDGFWLSNYNSNFNQLFDKNVNFLIYFKGLVPLKCFIKFAKNEECIGKKHDYSKIKFDYTTEKHNKFQFNKNDFISKNDVNPLYIQYSKTNVKQYIIPIIEKNLNINFHIFIPPHSTLSYKQYEFKNEVKILKEIISELSKYPNVKIYFFGNENFTDNMSNYVKDKQHYYKWINSNIAKAINKGTNIITINNMDEEFNKFIKKVENYDIKAYEKALRLNIKE